MEKRCKRCGNLTDRPKYCSECAPVVDHEKGLIRSQRYRDRHKEELRLSALKWREEHPEERRLHARNWLHLHPEKHKQSLQNWRKNNPDKVKAQNKRAKKKFRHKRLRLLSIHGKYPKFKWPVTCPKCERHFKTTAKRPQCSCGYSFPRRFIEKLIDNAPTKPCHTCGREIPYPGEGTIRKYCECCFPQITALKAVFGRERYLKDHPEPWRKWEQDNREVIVATTCRVCGNFILYKGIGKVPQKCGLCKCIERSRPKPTWNPKDIVTFIDVERRRLGLNKNKKWTKDEIALESERWERTGYRLEHAATCTEEE